MLSKKLYSSILAIFLLAGSLAVAQEKNDLDSLSDGLIESIYKEEPSTVNKEKRTSFNAYPFVFYTPESKLAFGGGGVFIFYTGEDKELKPSKIGFGGNYTTNNQYKLSISPNIYMAGNNLYFELPTSFGYSVNKYWGIGDETPAYENAAYTMQYFATTFKIQVPPEMFSADRTGIIVDYDNTEIVDYLENDLLKTDSTIIAPRGGQLWGLGTDLVWDSRDNIFFPNSGGYQYFKVVFYPGMSDYVFTVLELDVRAYRAIAPDHVFAAQFYIQSVTGDTPFYKMPLLGGQNRMRGYFNGRYRDNFYGMFQMEYRQYFSKRFGFVAFGGLGNVSSEMLAFQFDNLKYSYGAGLRYMFNKKQKVNLRMDIGFGNDGNRGVYFGIQEAF